MMIGVVLCKINEEINFLSIFHNHVVRIWLRNRPAKLMWNRNKNYVATDVMIEIFSLMWFYRNAVLFYIIFVVTHCEIFGYPEFRLEGVFEF